MDCYKRVEECRKYGIPPAALFIEAMWNGDELKPDARIPILDPTEEMIPSFKNRRDSAERTDIHETDNS